MEPVDLKRTSLSSLDEGQCSPPVGGGKGDVEKAGGHAAIDYPSPYVSPESSARKLMDWRPNGGQHASHSRRQSTEAVAAVPLSANTPIVKLYLTFDTELPLINAGAESSSATAAATTDLLPPAPDLTPYGDPHAWPESRKNVMLLLSCIATLLTAYAAGAYSPPTDLMAAEFGCSRTAVLVGITLFTTGFALAPMVLAPLSEIHGRYPVFVVSGAVYVAFQAACGAVTSLGGMLASRFFCGVGGSVFSTMVGGVIADIWHKDQRNRPMALFSGAVLVGTGLGPLSASVMVQRYGGDGAVIAGPLAKWKWVFWHQVILDFVLAVLIAVLFHESRGCVLLRRKANKLNEYYESLESRGCFGVWVKSPVESPLDALQQKHTMTKSAPSDAEKGLATQPMVTPYDVPPSGAKLQRIRWAVKEDEQHASIVQMISVSLLRPFHLLFTEPVVFFFSLWVSFAWATLYLTFAAIPLVFRRQYGFNTEQSGYVFIAMIVGSALATTIGVTQENLLRHPKWQRKAHAHEDAEEQGPSSKFWSFMRRHFPVEAPESRLYFICVSSILLPLGLYLFGFTSHPSIHWISPTIAIGLATMGIYYIYLATFNYLADAYHDYASSALAAQSFCRNILGGCFPLVVGPLFTNLGEDAAGGLLGAIATALTVVPWVLAFHGEKIRRRSKFAVSLAQRSS
ncbi:major facilitator superfamily transporter [Apiospora rasikravindrae]|uniref:Major facilitator superfamily transporter n=1 Tax=Apiospora rasikravindrae TaxID=990691 RepID=A0ABR1RPZ4_9PEZI